MFDIELCIRITAGDSNLYSIAVMSEIKSCHCSGHHINTTRKEDISERIVSYYTLVDFSVYKFYTRYKGKL